MSEHRIYAHPLDYVEPFSFKSLTIPKPLNSFYLFVFVCLGPEWYSKKTDKRLSLPICPSPQASPCILKCFHFIIHVSHLEKIYSDLSSESPAWRMLSSSYKMYFTKNSFNIKTEEQLLNWEDISCRQTSGESEGLSVKTNLILQLPKAPKHEVTVNPAVATDYWWLLYDIQDFCYHYKIILK